MPRKGPAPKRPLDVRPGVQVAAGNQLVSKVLKDGRRSPSASSTPRWKAAARRPAPTVVTLKRAMDNVKPAIEVKSRRVGGATYQVPIEVKGARGTTLALRWLVGYAFGPSVRRRCQSA